ncbi:hypothetical protein Tco_0602117 [Tanacetum coccineum]
MEESPYRQFRGDKQRAKAVLMANLSSYDSDVLSEKAPTLYDSYTIVKTHVALSVTDTEETLELAEEKQAFWLPISQPVSVKPPVLSEPLLKKDIPRELPSIRSLKKFKKQAEVLKPRSKDTRRTSGNTTRNDPISTIFDH